MGWPSRRRPRHRSARVVQPQPRPKKEVAMATPQFAPESLVMQMILSKWVSRSLDLAVELGIADMLATGPLSLEELAERSETHTPSLYRLLRALGGVGLFEETAGPCFGLTPLGDCLRESRLGPVARMFGSEWHDRAWRRLPDSVRTGRGGFSAAFGCSFGSWLHDNPDAAATVHAAQAAKVRTRIPALVATMDVTGVHRVADVGGGTGALLIGLLRANPHLQGVVVDRPEAVAGALKAIADEGFANRCTAAEGDFLEELPVEVDACLLSDVLHNWPDDICVAILRNCRRAVGPRGRVLAVEMVLPKCPEPSPATLLDLEMLVMSEGGRERSAEELGELFGKAELRLEAVNPTAAGVSVLDARAV